MTEKELGKCRKAFAYRHPNATFQPIDYGALPYRIRKNIDGREDLGISLEIEHEDTTKTYVGQSSSLETVFLHDRDRRNKYLGEGVIYLQNFDDDLYIPVVGFTFTAKPQREKGIGTRRLFIMDTLSRLVFEQPLHSSSAPRLSQKSIWERLVEQKVAEYHYFEGVQRYKFIK